MKTFRTAKGPFAERPYYKEHEIENICTDALREVGLLPANPEPIRIDRFIEKRFGVVPSYEDLPEGVLGLTRFGKNGVQEVVVANALDGDSSATAARRVRTTLAHEGGHCLLHTHLFVLATRPRIFWVILANQQNPRSYVGMRRILSIPDSGGNFKPTWPWGTCSCRGSLYSRQRRSSWLPWGALAGGESILSDANLQSALWRRPSR